MRLYLRAVLALGIVIVGGACESRVHVSVTAPVEWAGSTVKVNGKDVGEFQIVRTETGGRAVERAVLSFAVPLGENEILVQKPGHHEIRKVLRYDRAGEDYLNLEELPVPTG